MSKRYESYVTCWRRLKEWEKDGTWKRIWRKLLQQCEEKGKIDWNHAFLDGTFVPAKKGGDLVGVTKVGKGSKVMMVTDGNGFPLAIHVASAQLHEIRLAEKTVGLTHVPSRRGRPRTCPKKLVADRVVVL